MLSLRRHIASLGIFIVLAIATRPIMCRARSSISELVVVPANKLPRQAHQKGQSMDLCLVDPDTLYLYVEQEDGRQLAIFDVSDPSKVKFRKLAVLNAPAPFDFVQPVGQLLEMIRYRDGSGIAILDLSKPKTPVLKSAGSKHTGYYIMPSGSNYDDAKALAASRDYQIIETSKSEVLATVKNVIQQQTDEGNGTTYLLGDNGLTVIRNLKRERKLAATSRFWSNTIDDN